MPKPLTANIGGRQIKLTIHSSQLTQHAVNMLEEACATWSYAGKSLYLLYICENLREEATPDVSSQDWSFSRTSVFN